MGWGVEGGSLSAVAASDATDARRRGQPVRKGRLFTWVLFAPVLFYTLYFVVRKAHTAAITTCGRGIGGLNGHGLGMVVLSHTYTTQKVASLNFTTASKLGSTGI